MFPYLEIEEFFFYLNEWRFYLGRATLDDEVILEAFNKVVKTMNVDDFKSR